MGSSGSWDQRSPCLRHEGRAGARLARGDDPAAGHRAGAEDRLDGAEKLLREAQAQQPHVASISFNLGLLLAELGRPEEAERQLRAALEDDSRMAPAAYNLAVLVGGRSPANAVPLARRAVELRPEDARYAWTLGLFQARSGDFPGAGETLEGLLRAHPEHDDARRLLAEIYARQGRTAEAGALLLKRTSPPAP